MSQLLARRRQSVFLHLQDEIEGQVGVLSQVKGKDKLIADAVAYHLNQAIESLKAARGLLVKP